MPDQAQLDDFLDALETAGSPVKYRPLREALGREASLYEEVKAALTSIGIVMRGKGPSNSVSLVGTESVANAVEPAEYSHKFIPVHFAETQKSFMLEDGDQVIAITDMENNPKILGFLTFFRNLSQRNLLLKQRVRKLVLMNNLRVNFEHLRFNLSRRPAKRCLVSCAKKNENHA
jgi:hypothetical protein